MSNVFMRPFSLLLCLGALTALACGKHSSPAAPSGSSTPPPPVQLSACSSWANAQRGTGVPAAAGDVAAQRSALYAAGGGVRAVGSKYFAAWFPASWATSSPRRVLVGLHGTGGAPETEWFIDWKDILSQRGWAYMGLKYVDAGGTHDNETQSGTMERLYQDPSGGHGGLAKNIDAWGSMFAYFESLR